MGINWNLEIPIVRKRFSMESSFVTASFSAHEELQFLFKLVKIRESIATNKTKSDNFSAKNK